VSGVTRITKPFIDNILDGVDEKLDQTEANALYERPVANTLGVIGDSITDFGWGTNSIYEGKNLRGYYVWALARLGQRLKFLKDGGVAGDTTAQMLARIDAYIGSQVPAWTWILGGTNDAAGLVPLDTTTANLTAILDKIEAAGGRCLLLTVPPRTGASAAINTRINEINNWIRRQGFTRPNLLVADIFPKLAADTNYGYRTGASQDNVHPLPHGAALMGEVVANVVDPFIPKLSPLPSAITDGVNRITNALMTGTGGTANAGGTGQVADSWLVSAVDGVASVFECSKVARTDGVAGVWQQVHVTSGQVKAHWHVPYAAGAGYTFGDRYYAVCEFETDDDLVQGDGVASNYFRLRMAATKPDFGDGFAGVDFDVANDTIQAPSSLMLRKGVLVTPVITVPSSATNRLGFEIQRRGAGTFRFSRAGIYREGTGPMF
jgi:lysophospholipase L1-like esterase